jgi:hypothetical protein
MIPRINSVNETPIASPVVFFRELGNLHDAVITEVSWRPTQREIVFLVADVYANFSGLPEHPGVQPAALILRGIKTLQADLTPDRFPAHISDFEIQGAASEA